MPRHPARENSEVKTGLRLRGLKRNCVLPFFLWTAS